MCGVPATTEEPEVCVSRKRGNGSKTIVFTRGDMQAARIAYQVAMTLETVELQEPLRAWVWVGSLRVGYPLDNLLLWYTTPALTSQVKCTVRAI